MDESRFNKSGVKRNSITRKGETSRSKYLICKQKAHKDPGTNAEAEGKQTQSIGLSSMSFSDSAIHKCNRIIIDKSTKEEAEKLRNIGSELSVSFEGNEEGIIEKFVEMEARDKAGISPTRVKEGYL